jgi:hypothetical protein
LPAMSTKSREVIWGGQIRGAKMRAESAREAARKAISWPTLLTDPRELIILQRGYAFMLSRASAHSSEEIFAKEPAANMPTLSPTGRESHE